MTMHRLAALVVVLGTLSPTRADDDLSVTSQWGRTSHRNNVYEGALPIDWETPDDRRRDPGRGVRWSVAVKARTSSPAGFAGDPAVSDGRVFIGSAALGGDYLERLPEFDDYSLLLCFQESDGAFLWQYNSKRLPAGLPQDYVHNPITSTPYVEGDRLWFVTNRCEVVCLDTRGFADGENDGPFRDESHVTENEADVVWTLDMIGGLGVSPHQMSNCSMTSAGDRLFVCTSNGVDASEANVGAPDAPSFLALEKQTGRILWSDNSPGDRILDGQWASPAYGVLGGAPQVIFASGDGWVYSFDPAGDEQGNSRLLWEFDCNPKESRKVGWRGDRHNIIATPVIYDGRVYVAPGEERAEGTGQGRLWCIDPTKRGDVSPELVFNEADPARPISHRRFQECRRDEGDFTRENPNSAALWCYTGADINRDGEIAVNETMHGALSAPAIKDGLLFIGDDEAIFHCVDADTGEAVWIYDPFSMMDGSPLISRDHVYVGTEDGEVLVFECSREMTLVAEIDMLQSVEGTPVAAVGVLYITTPWRLYAIDGR